MNVAQYIAAVQKLVASGQTTEHSFRPVLNQLFDAVVAGVTAINEPKAVKVGRPDFVFLREAGKGAYITVGHCEAKDIGLDVNPKSMKDFNKSQFDRYVKALPNLIYTNGLDFRFYKNGELAREISIADYLMGVQPKPDQFDVLANQLRDFAKERLQTITNAESLAEMMAGKAVLIKDILHNTLKEDKDLQTELASQFKAFKDQLIHDLDVEEFSDIYAETIAYGMFAARLHDETKDTFTREEALALLPKSNPFLRNLFGYVAGPTLDDGIRRTVDELAEIFQATDLQKLFENFGKFTQRNDPFIHFYETFLAEYNPAKRKARGVWYTPEPVVNFIVRAVDDVLKTEFGLADGLADTSKITIDWDTGQTHKGKPVIEKKEVHRVQILDPAAGTGTFLAEVIKQIAPKVKDIAPGQWSKYVETELIPRLHGFELLMASYAMCHMKLDMMLTQLGYKPTGTNAPRLGVYLTNSLEEGEKVNQTLPFAQWLSNEAKQANTVKRDVPVMCVIGNPPYSGVSSNRGKWITQLIDAYKFEPGGKVRLQERSSKFINDDYVKFIRFAEYMIEKNGEGILGYITNHSYLVSPTFRGMRWHLQKTFDKLFVIDLHGSLLKNEVSPDGSVDQNVFDIQPGVCIVIGVKKRPYKDNKNSIFYGELWGSRESKYRRLWSEKYNVLSGNLLDYNFSNNSFSLLDYTMHSEFERGFNIRSLFLKSVIGMQTGKDSVLIAQTKKQILENVNKEYGCGIADQYIREISYRPFDDRWVVFAYSNTYQKYDGPKMPGSYRPRYDIQRHLLESNFAILSPRQLGLSEYRHSFITNKIAEMCVVSNFTKEQNVVFPLYLYPEEGSLDQTRRVNMDPKIRKAIEDAAMGAPPSSLWRGIEGGGRERSEPAKNLTDNRKDFREATPAPNPSPKGGGGQVGTRPDEVAIFDYIYGVLHCPAYRETYREFLKIDFPRIPYPPSPEVFWDVSAKGTALRRLHLMDDAVIGEAPYPFTGEGGSVVGKVEFRPVGATGRVYVNEEQCFENVPEVAWNFYIGGYQPAQKWLKDRKGRELSFDDIKHYRKIIKILTETDRIMKTIEMPLNN